MSKNDERRSVRCSFCGKPQSMVERLIAGNGSYICDECVRMCMSIVSEDDLLQVENHDPALVLEELPKPIQIKEHLDQYVIGQDNAKKFLRLRYITIISGYCTKSREM